MNKFESINPTSAALPETDPSLAELAATPEAAPVAASYKEYVEKPEYESKVLELRPMITVMSLPYLKPINPEDPKSPWKWDIMKGEFATELQDGYELSRKQLEGYRLFHLLEGSSPDEDLVPIVGFDINNPNAEEGKVGVIEGYIRRMYANGQKAKEPEVPAEELATE